LQEVFNKISNSPNCYADDLIELDRAYKQKTKAIVDLDKLSKVKKSLELEDSTTQGARYTTQMTVNMLEQLMDLGMTTLKQNNPDIHQYFQNVNNIITEKRVIALKKIVINMEHLAQLSNAIPKSSNKLHKNAKSDCKALISKFHKIIGKENSTAISALNSPNKIAKTTLGQNVSSTTPSAQLDNETSTVEINNPLYLLARAALTEKK
jgi:Ni,Fe-hydrogenase I large subunit